MSVSQAVARPVRTGAQLVPALVLTEGIDALVVDLTDRQYGAVVGLFTLLLGWLQVVLEDRAGWAFLRRPQGAPVSTVETVPAADAGGG